jgi:hypothetical protein
MPSGSIIRVKTFYRSTMRLSILAACAALALHVPAGAQTPRPGWEQLLSRFAPMSTPPQIAPPGTGRCGARISFPDTITVDGPHETGASFTTYTLSRGAPFGIEVERPNAFDRFPFHVVKVVCRPEDGRVRLVLLENGGRYVLYSAPLTTSTYSDLRTKRADGNPIGFAWYGPTQTFGPEDRVAREAEAHQGSEAQAVRASVAAAASAQRQEEEARASERLRYLRSRGYSARTIAQMQEGVIAIGWTTRMVLDSWGEPDDIRTTVTRTTRSEQWFYGGGAYVYFENGRVSIIQN